MRTIILILAFFLIVFVLLFISTSTLKIFQLNQKISKTYLHKIGINNQYVFSNGKKIIPLPIKETTRNKVMIIGAYPSAVFDYRGGNIVPIDNLNKAFDDTVREGQVNKSAQELENKILLPLGISRTDCWITNLVKVFLVKKAHEKHYSSFKVEANRQKFYKYGQKSMSFLVEEIHIANPKLIIALGEEVATVLKNSKLEKFDEFSYKLQRLNIDNKAYNIVYIAHPGALMREGKWSKIHDSKIIEIKEKISTIID